MAIDFRYGKVTVERDPDFEEDEIVVVFRARDKLLLEVLNFYHDITLREGSEKEFVLNLQREIALIRRWQRDNEELLRPPDQLN